MCMSKLELKLEMGQHPNIKVELNIKSFLGSLKENDLNKLIELSKLRLECVKK